MSHSLTKIWIHSIFSTKDWEKTISNKFAGKLYNHITEQLTCQFECRVKSINGIPDHVHILLLLNPVYSISDILKNVKGESSHWINQNNFLNIKFSWQTGYGAFSVSESDVDKVSKYIENQHEHHKKMTFMEEYELFMKKYGIKFANR